MSSCKTPTSWNLVASNTNVVLFDGFNMNRPLEGNADVETQAFVYQNAQNNTATPFITGFLCYTPLGRSYFFNGTAPPVFDGLMPTLSPIELRVTRANGGNTRSVLVPPNGMARLFSHL